MSTHKMPRVDNWLYNLLKQARTGKKVPRKVIMRKLKK
jgi:hypothetical protein